MKGALDELLEALAAKDAEIERLREALEQIAELPTWATGYQEIARKALTAGHGHKQL